jgi:tetratricopeptide (TPR) repeat protein
MVCFFMLIYQGFGTKNVLANIFPGFKLLKVSAMKTTITLLLCAAFFNANAQVPDPQNKITSSALTQNAVTPNSGIQTADGYFKTGSDKTYNKQYDSALYFYNRAIELNPSLAIAYNNRGEIYYMLGKYATALPDLNQAILLDPVLTGALLNRAAVNIRLGHYNEAIEDYSNFIRTDRAVAEAWYNRGTLYLLMNDNSKAWTDLSRAIELNPIYAEAYNNRGLARFKLFDQRGAVADYDIALQLRPNFVQALLNRSAAAIKLGDNNSSASYYTRALAVNAGYVSAYLKRADPNANSLDYTGAIADPDQRIGWWRQRGETGYQVGNAGY